MSKKTDYALRTVFELASRGEGALITVAEIASSQNIPTNFLEQILLTLKGVGIVASRRGQQGGYYLAQQPQEISLASVVRLTEGNLAPTDCAAVQQGSGCPRRQTCPIHEVWDDIHGYITQKLEGLSMSDMCQRSRQLQMGTEPEYMI